MDCPSFHLSIDLVMRIPDLVGNLDLVLWLGGVWIQQRLLSGRPASVITIKASRFKFKWKHEAEHR